MGINCDVLEFLIDTSIIPIFNSRGLYGFETTYPNSNVFSSSVSDLLRKEYPLMKEADILLLPQYVYDQTRPFLRDYAAKHRMSSIWSRERDNLLKHLRSSVDSWYYDVINTYANN